MSCFAREAAFFLDTGDEYKLDELKEQAWRIMTVERKSRT
jgi:hypothetical protein